MAVREIRILGDPVLRTPADEVTRFDGRLRQLVGDLLDTLDADPDGRAGVAAPQIGVSLRVFAYDVHGSRGHLVNPVISELSDEVQDGEEGCLSVPGMWFPTRRAYRAVATGVDMHGEAVTVRGEGVLARCLQHETDHLDGTVYVDRLDRKQRNQAMRRIVAG